MLLKCGQIHPRRSSRILKLPSSLLGFHATAIEYWQYTQHYGFPLLFTYISIYQLRNLEKVYCVTRPVKCACALVDEYVYTHHAMQYRTHSEK